MATVFAIGPPVASRCRIGSSAGGCRRRVMVGRQRVQRGYAEAGQQLGSAARIGGDDDRARRQRLSVDRHVTRLDPRDPPARPQRLRRQRLGELGGERAHARGGHGDRPQREAAPHQSHVGRRGHEFALAEHTGQERPKERARRPGRPGGRRPGRGRRTGRSAPRCAAGGVASTRIVQATSRALSSGPKQPVDGGRQASAGRRSGLPKVCSPPSSPRIAAPGTNGRRCSAARPAAARSAG